MENKNKKFLIFGLCATFAALFVHAYLAIKYYRLHYGNSLGQSSCNINALFNCDATSASSYAQAFGVPVAIWGFSANLILLLLGLIVLTGFAERPRRAHNAGLLLSLLVLLTSVAMAVISSFKLGTYCLYCIALYVLSFFTWFGYWLSRDKETGWPEEIRSIFAEDKWLLIYLLGVPGLSFVFNSIAMDSFGMKNFDRVVQESLANWSSSPTYTFDTEAGLKLKPNLTNPKVTIVEFADFLCPHCKHAYPTLHAFAESHDDVQFIFKVFPLDGTCNPDPMMKGSGNGVRCRLSLATLCAESTAKMGWTVHHSIFDNQESYFSVAQTDDVDKKICEIPGIKCEELKSCMNSPDTTTLLKNLSQEGMNAKIRGTPSIFVNGKLLEAGQTIPVLQGVYNIIK